jgi:HSP20 family molecular chaperone IbpA
MDPMGRMYGGMEDWRAGAYSAPADYGAYAGYQGPGRFGRDIDYRYGQYRQYDRGFEEEAGDWRRWEGGEHTWRGGLLGWLGSGLRAGAAWIGNRMQSWGGLLGGKLQGTTEELGRAMRGRGEQMGSAMEHHGEHLMHGPRWRGYEGRPPRAYRRPDDRILDDVYQRVAMTGTDADEIEIEVRDGVVTLSGRVPRRLDKRLIEEVAEQVFGVRDVQNNVRLARRVEERGAEQRAPGANRAPGNGENYSPSASPRP